MIKSICLCHITDVFLAGAGYCDNLLPVIRAICCSCVVAFQHCLRWTGLGPPAGNTICMGNRRKSTLLANNAYRLERGREDWLRETYATSKTVSQCPWMLFLPHKGLLYFSSLHLPFCMSLTQVGPNNNPENSQTKILFFSDENAMQNVFSCNHRMFYFHCSSQHLFQLL